MIEPVTFDYVDTVLNTAGGTGPISNNANLWIDSVLESHWIDITVEDDGAGFRRAPHTDQTP